MLAARMWFSPLTGTRDTRHRSQAWRSRNQGRSGRPRRRGRHLATQSLPTPQSSGVLRDRWCRSLPGSFCTASSRRRRCLCTCLLRRARNPASKQTKRVESGPYRRCILFAQAAGSLRAGGSLDTRWHLCRAQICQLHKPDTPARWRSHLSRGARKTRGRTRMRVYYWMQQPSLSWMGTADSRLLPKSALSLRHNGLQGSRDRCKGPDKACRCLGGMVCTLFSRRCSQSRNGTPPRSQPRS